ncbi:OLC1v1029181C1 [Oldenlandia corymbosa var. corymbosa]|uniref:OLC1v1029181C1 n=1 Tax=Oldenlandia corymbosa var. corymbosa TaxID=529605 RepID=A0AAV1CGK1_OLDCO|nr:OLC1v1029181C1 [Oldenlandia corymbosa var. corymbosa]
MKALLSNDSIGEFSDVFCKHDFTLGFVEEARKTFEDIIYGKAVGEDITKITINKPERRNSFKPQTVKELMKAFNDARDDIQIGVIISNGTGTKIFCSGGDPSFRGKNGYAEYDNSGRLNVLDLHVQICQLPKPVIAMLAGYAVGGGQVLHMVCDISIAASKQIHLLLGSQRISSLLSTRGKDFGSLHSYHCQEARILRIVLKDVVCGNIETFDFTGEIQLRCRIPVDYSALLWVI